MINESGAISPESVDLTGSFTGLTELAGSKLKTDLHHFGNNPSDDQWAALSKVLSCYTQIALGNASGRWAFPLPTGMGKTRSIVAWLWAVNERGFSDHISVIFAASKVEALCRLKRDLIEAGISEDKIGLVHSYRFDEAMAEDYRVGKLEELSSGYASEPTTEDYESKPFLLITHQRIKGKKGISQYNVFRGNPRNLVIWDESLLSSETFAFEDDRIRASWAWLKEFDRVKSPQRDEALSYLKTAIDKIKQEIYTQQRDPVRRVRVFNLPDLNGDLIEKYKAALGSGEQANLLRDLLDVSQEQLRLLCNVEQGGGVITFRVSVPQELQNIVVLDASYPIRELAKLDPSITQADIAHDIVSYEDVTIHQLNHASGRGAMEKEFSKKRGYNPITREVADVIKCIPSDEAILIFTFKDYGGIKYRQRLERDFEDEDIDTKAKVDVNGELRPRVNFLTWGNETSLSQYSYCSNVILVGIIHRSHIDIGGAILGQTGDISRPVDNGEIRDVVQSEVSHAVYQAVSRGACRVIQGMKTRPMNVWLMHPEREGLKSRIDVVMTGVRWKKWEPRFLISEKTPRDTKVRLLAQNIKSHLDRNLNSDVAKVSFIKLKNDIAGPAGIKLKDISNSTVQRAIKLAIESAGGTFVIRGRTVWRAAALYFGET